MDFTKFENGLRKFRKGNNWNQGAKQILEIDLQRVRSTQNVIAEIAFRVDRFEMHVRVMQCVRQDRPVSFSAFSSSTHPRARESQPYSSGLTFLGARARTIICRHLI